MRAPMMRALQAWTSIAMAATLLACGSTGLGQMVPLAPPLDAPKGSVVGLRTTIVLDERLTATTLETPLVYPQADGVARPFRFRTGLGLAHSLEARLTPLFADHRVVGSMNTALVPAKGQPRPELILWPRLAALSLEDTDGTVHVDMTVRVLMLSGDGTPLEAFDVAQRTVWSDRGTDDGEDRDRRRLRSALDAAFGRILDDLAVRVSQHEALAPIAAGRAVPLANALAVRHRAAVQCAEQRGESRAKIERDFGLDIVAVRQRLERRERSFGPAERLALALTDCDQPTLATERSLEARLAQIRAHIDSGDLGAAHALLYPLAEVHPKHPAIATVVRKLARAEEAQRLAEEAERRREAERLAAEEAARRAEEARLAAEAAARAEAEAQAQRAQEADLLAKQAAARLRAGRVDEARDLVQRAWQLVPQHAGAREVMLSLREHDERMERTRRAAEEAARKRELAQIQRQVPTLIKKCVDSAQRYRKAEQKAAEAAASGNPERVEKMGAAKHKAWQTYMDAQAKLRKAIEAYESQGQHDAARGVRQAAAPCGRF